MGKITNVLWLRKIFMLNAFLIFFGCVKDREFDAPKSSCITDLAANATFGKVKNLYEDGVIQINEDWVIEGYVSSSDESGNFFSTLHFQDKPNNPTEGFQVSIDVRDSWLFYSPGSKIYIKLKGLYLGKQKGVYKLGGVFTSFGNLSIGRLPATIVDQHIFTSCEEYSIIEPTIIEIGSIQDNHINTLVQLNNVEIHENELGMPFAEVAQETKRTIVDCNGNVLVLVNSGYSDFKSEILPEGNGSVVGVLLKDNDDYQMVIRDLNDIDLQNQRCEKVIDEFTSNSIFISELADPNNNSGARFVELYNAGTASLSLNGWMLRRYTNENTEISSIADLTGFEIDSERTLVIAPNATEFETVYGFVPDVVLGTNSPADSNGDDNLELVDPFGTIIDVFGVVGEDGTGTDHEFEDGRVLRKPEVLQANSTFTFTEWMIYNDSGGSGTINEPQNAPDDFSPGSHN